MAATKNETSVQTLFKDKFMIWIFRGIGLVLFIFLIIIAIKALTGKPVNLFGLQINQPQQTHDTVKLNSGESATVNKITPHIDSGTQNIVTQSDNKGNINNEFVSGNKVVTKKEGQKAKNIVNGTNNGIAGDVTINNGMAKRELTDEYKQIVVTRIMDSLNSHGLPKSYPIKFSSHIGSNEALEFTKEVMNYLFSVGFTGIKNSIYPFNTATELFLYFDNDEGHLLISLGLKY